LLPYFHLPSLLEAKLKRLVWQQFVGVYGRLPIVTAPTKTAAELVQRYGLAREVIVLSCGIDLQRFNQSYNGTYLKVRYNIPDRPIILYVGRLDKGKNIEVILRAMPFMLERTRAQLVLVGVGAMRNHLERVAQELGLRKDVVFTGLVADDDLPNLYRLADIFVLAGIAELQSIATMEAMASALPIVAVNAVALPELIRHGENGFLFPDGDSQGVTEKIISILTDERLKGEMGQKSLALIQAHDMSRVVRAI